MADHFPCFNQGVASTSCINNCRSIFEFLTDTLPNTTAHFEIWTEVSSRNSYYQNTHMYTQKKKQKNTDCIIGVSMTLHIIGIFIQLCMYSNYLSGSILYVLKITETSGIYVQYVYKFMKYISSLTFHDWHCIWWGLLKGTQILKMLYVQTLSPCSLNSSNL